MNDDADGPAREARVLDVLRDRPEWPTAMERLRQLYTRGGAAAQEAAVGYDQKYARQRGAMVVDVVASRQRNYQSMQVVQMVNSMGNVVAEERSPETAGEFVPAAT